MTLGEVINKFNVGSYIFLGLFLLFSIVQLVLAFLEKEELRQKEKPFCLLSLSCFALFTLVDHPLIYVGAFLGMLGDIFVVIKNKKYFNFGVLCFLLGHICYAVEALLFLNNKTFEWFEYLILLLSFAFVYVCLFAFTKKFAKKKTDVFGSGLYYGSLVAFLALMIILYINNGLFLYLSIIGLSFFVISDIIILYTKYIKKFKRNDFYIMLTYLLAQFFLVMSLVLSVLGTLK